MALQKNHHDAVGGTTDPLVLAQLEHPEACTMLRHLLDRRLKVLGFALVLNAGMLSVSASTEDAQEQPLLAVFAIAATSAFWGIECRTLKLVDDVIDFIRDLERRVGMSMAASAMPPDATAGRVTRTYVQFLYGLIVCLWIMQAVADLRGLEVSPNTQEHRTEADQPAASR